MSAIVNYFPISKELPSDIVAIDNAWNNINKGICPNCHNQWIVDINNFSENGNIYKN